MKMFFLNKRQSEPANPNPLFVVGIRAATVIGLFATGFGSMTLIMGGCRMANTPQTNVKTDRSTVGTRQTVGPKSVTTQKANSSSQLAPPITATEGKAFLAGDAKSLRTPSHTLTYGRSAQGRALRAHVLGNGPDTTIIFGAFHGNEPATPGVVQRLMVYLQQQEQLQLAENAERMKEGGMA